MLTAKNPEIDRKAFLTVLGPLVNVSDDRALDFLREEARQAQYLSKVVEI